MDTLKYIWRPATGNDIMAIVDMAQRDFESEIDEIFVPDPEVYARNIISAVATQSVVPTHELLMVAHDQHQQLIAYVWVNKQTAPWSDQVMATVRMAHLDLTLPARTRIKLVRDMIGLWEVWAVESSCDIVCSTTMRRDTQGFMRLHAQAGYDIRGSIAYKRLQKEQK